MNVLVIGGAGYIGSHVVYELLRQKQNVIVFDDLSTGNQQAIPQEVKFYKGSQLDSKHLDQVFNENKIDVVMLFSAKLIVSESIQKPIMYFENNINGVANILKVMLKNHIQNIVFSSTAAVYGNLQKNVPVKEEDYKNPINPYGQSKLACEWLIKNAHQTHQINYAIFRYFNVAGADASGAIGQSTKGSNKLTHLIPLIIEVATKQRAKLQIYGNDYDTKDGTCIRDYVHVSDLAIAHIQGAMFVLQGKSNTFNIGSSQGFSVLEILQKAKMVTNQKIESEISGRRNGDPPFLVADNSKIKKVLGWKPKYGIEEMIESDYKWRLNKKF